MNSASGDPSYVLRALGRDTELAQSSLRFSLGRFTTPQDIDLAVEAVRREVLEESGIQIGRVRYLASQPWPFPSSLMMGFLGEALTEEITIDPEELAEVRWFERDEVRAMVERSRSDDPIPGLPTLPPPLAIGHQIARRWAFGADSV